MGTSEQDDGSRHESELSAERALLVAGALAEIEAFEAALAVLSCGAAASHPDAARMRAQCAMHLERYDVAIAAADVAITALLHDGLDVESFVRLSLRGAQVEGLMRVDRDAVAQLRRLHEPFALRWEALQRSGRTLEARLMRALCICHFPERASVWAAAGNQALDEGEPNEAEGYFERCLALAPNWTAGLAGRAIVFETRKDWARALEYREAVVRVERSLERDDSPNIQRVMRLAAALGRSDRWTEAGVLFRRCVALRAFELLPAERPVLLRVFSRELYAPACIAALASQLPSAVGAGASEEVHLALREAAAFGAAFAALLAREDLDPGERMLLLGMCAWLAGDAPRAYALLDEAEVHDQNDLATQYLLACCAVSLIAPECSSIVGFAVQAARAFLQHRAQDASEDEAMFYARVILARFGGSERETAPMPAAFDAAAPAALPAQLRRLVAFRTALRANGGSALDAARSSTEAVAHLERTLAATFADPSS